MGECVKFMDFLWVLYCSESQKCIGYQISSGPEAFISAFKSIISFAFLNSFCIKLYFNWELRTFHLHLLKEVRSLSCERVQSRTRPVGIIHWCSFRGSGDQITSILQERNPAGGRINTTMPSCFSFSADPV